MLVVEGGDWRERRRLQVGVRFTGSFVNSDVWNSGFLCPKLVALEGLFVFFCSCGDWSVVEKMLLFLQFQWRWRLGRFTVTGVWSEV